MSIGQKCILYLLHAEQPQIQRALAVNRVKMLLNIDIRENFNETESVACMLSLFMCFLFQKHPGPSCSKHR